MADAKPHFFRPLLPGFEHQLSIPAAFSKYLDGGDAAELISPGGKRYPVKIAGREFRDEGWKEFVADHDLHVGDFLVFRYSAHMVFDVMAFDHSACEIHYRSSPSPLPVQAPVGSKHDDEPVDNGRDPHNDARPTQRKKDQVKEKGGWSLPINPFVVVTISRRNLEKKLLHISKVLWRHIDFGSTKRRNVILLNEVGKSWSADLLCYKKLSHSKSGHQFYLSRGLNEFLEENRVRLGDTFNLELVQGGDNPVFKMSGLHSNPTAIKEEMEKEKRKKMEWEIMKELVSSPGYSETMHPFFLATMTSTSIRGNTMHIPCGFVRMNGLAGVTRPMILRNDKGSSYLVTLKPTKEDRACLRSGWKELVMANGLREGDVLMFQLIETGTRPVMTFKFCTRKLE